MCSIFNVPHDILVRILFPFKYTEDSLFVSLVCRKWFSIVGINNFSLSERLEYYTVEGYLSSIQYIFRFPINRNRFETLCYAAAFGGQLETLKWLIQESFPYNSTALLIGAAREGNYHIIEWLLSIGHNWHPNICAGVAAKGNLEMLKWLRNEGCPWEELTCTEAALNGHLELLDWAIQNGCPTEEDITVCAAERNHFELLMWLHEKGYKLTRDTFNAAIEVRNVAMIEWLREQRCPISWSIELALDQILKELKS